MAVSTHRKRVKKILNSIEEYLSFSFFIIVFLVLLYQIITRNIFNSPSVFSEGLALLLFCYCIFFGISMSVVKKENIRFNILYNAFKPSVGNVLYIVIDIITIIIFIYFIYTGFVIAERKSIVDIVSLGISSSYYFFAFPLGSFFIVIRLIQRIMVIAKNMDKKLW